jgi:hypothetical protein
MHRIPDPDPDPQHWMPGKVMVSTESGTRNSGWYTKKVFRNAELSNKSNKKQNNKKVINAFGVLQFPCLRSVGAYITEAIANVNQRLLQSNQCCGCGSEWVLNSE